MKKIILTALTLLSVTNSECFDLNIKTTSNQSKIDNLKKIFHQSKPALKKMITIVAVYYTINGINDATQTIRNLINKNSIRENLKDLTSDIFFLGCAIYVTNNLLETEPKKTNSHKIIYKDTETQTE